MTSQRPRWVAAATLAGLLVLSACGSDGDSGSLADATPSATATASKDADGFTAEEREVIDAVERYQDAILLRGTKSVEATLDGLTTDELFDRMVPQMKAATEDKGLQFIGTYTLEPEVVTISGDSAELHACLDSSRSALVERGQKEAGVGAIPGGLADMKYGLVKVDGVWLVNDPLKESATC